MKENKTEQGATTSQKDPGKHLVLFLASQALDNHLQEWGVLTEGLAINREVIKHVLASVDWGFTSPGVMQVCGVDGDDRAYLLREIYQTGKTVDDYWVPLARQLKQEYGITHFICDPFLLSLNRQARKSFSRLSSSALI